MVGSWCFIRAHPSIPRRSDSFGERGQWGKGVSSVSGRFRPCRETINLRTDDSRANTSAFEVIVQVRRSYPHP